MLKGYNKMEIKQLEYFRAIVDAGTISGAARTLHMTQPPISYQIKMLEEELGVRLFVRGAKNITLTEAGKVLYIRATSLLTMADITKREVIKANEAVTIHIGLAPSTVSMMAKHFKKYAIKHPEIHFDIHEGSTFNLKNQLENRVVDITTLRTPISVNGFESRVLMTDELCAMAIPQKELGKDNIITLKELSKERLILSHRYRGFLLSAFEKNELSGDIYYECEDARTAMTLAENGLGIAILPASMRPLADKCFVYKIDSKELVTEVILAWNKEKITNEVKAFLDFLFSNTL